jgi:2,4-didehydro-3-deoxy-L-rhamnonate hydrolase
MRHLIHAVLMLAICATAQSQPPPAIELAPLDRALSFARIDRGAGPELFAVLRYGHDTVDAVPLTADDGTPVSDALRLFAELGYDGLRERIEQGIPQTLETSALLQPLDLAAHHIAAGTNFTAHADESQVDGGPFLFPKLVMPTGPRAPVAATGRLLDYEVELCWVALQDLGPDDRPAHWGLLLCNDYTDRAALLRHLDPDDIGSGTGFATGKSFDGALPVGDLLVIPRDARAFAQNLLLRLYRNGELRQDAPYRLAIWEIDDILDQAWQRHDTTWAHAGAQVGLFAQRGVLPARTLILSGTPDGTVFQGISTMQKLRGAMRWIAGGFDGALTDAVIETYIADAQAQRSFLQPGETVLIRSDWLGSIENRIEP